VLRVRRLQKYMAEELLPGNLIFMYSCKSGPCK
jgi:hypothetical protein